MDYRDIALKLAPADAALSARSMAEKDFPVTAVVSLIRPERRNAMDDNTLRELADVFSRVGRLENVRAVIVRGEGPDFCAGADIDWMRRAGQLSPAQGRKDAKLLADMCLAVDSCPVPVIARVHGAVYGGGLGLAAACDVVVAADNAKMCFSECRLGILPAVVSCFVVPKIGSSAARRYYLTSEVFDMQAARDIGLVHIAAPPRELDAHVEAVVGSILRNGPKAVRQAKAVLRRLPGMPLDKALKFTVDALVRVRSTPEAQEGLSAFLEKRPPSWILSKP